MKVTKEQQIINCMVRVCEETNEPSFCTFECMLVIIMTKYAIRNIVISSLPISNEFYL